MNASFSFHHSNLQLAYSTQAWILKFKTCAIQANIWNAHSKCNIQVYELAPPTCVQFLIDPLTISFHLFAPPILLSLWIYLTIFVNFSPPLSTISIKRWAQILDRLGWNHVKWGSFSNLVQSRSLAKDI